MAKYVAESVWIASIYPGAMPPITKNVGPKPSPRSERATVYRLKPVPRDRWKKPHLLEVTDAFENVPNPIKAAESNRGDRIGANMVFDTSPVPCEEIAANLIQEWAGNMVGIPPGASPGIMQIVGTTPTEAELEQLFRMQSLFFEYLFQEGEKLARVHDYKGITQTMRDASVWLGHERVWSVPQDSKAVSNCPACTKVINAAALVCEHCGTRVKALPPELAALNPALPGPINPPLKSPTATL